MRLLFILCVMMLSSPALAQETATPSHGMAMHGDLKYKADYTHFDYTNPDAPKGGALKLSALGTFDSLNPFIVKGTPAAGLIYIGQSFLYDALMEQSYDEPFSMYCLLCETVERDPGNKWIAFNLRKEAKWQDGQPVTADDVVWSFHTFMDKGTPFFKAYYGDVQDVTAESPTRVKFTFKTADNKELPLIVGQLTVLPKHYWTDGKHTFDKTSLEAPVGSGPYKIGTISAGRSIQYARDPNYWGKDLPINKGRFNFDTIQYDYYRDANVSLESFFAGNYDTREENTAKLWFTAYDTPQVKEGRVIKQEIPHHRPQGIQGFLYNVRKPVFSDAKVREALAYAFDFDWSNKQFAYGKYVRSRSYFSNSELAATGIPAGKELEILNKFKGRVPAEVFTTEYNPPKTDGSGNNRDNLRKAAEILEANGYKLGPDGVRAKGNVKLQFEIIDTNPEFERWVLPFIRNLDRIGVKATFRVIDTAQYQNRMNVFDYDMTISSFGQSDSPGNEQRDFFGSAKADAQGSRNYIGVKDPVVDDIITGIIQSQSREDLVAYCHALDRVLQWNYYLIPQWYLDHWRLAWWAKLEHPEHLSGLTPAITDTWWVKQETKK